ncbi:chorismate pyruvate-lyase family protein [Streptomyces sp. NPDC006482]|uniref:chorismate pyruvate-lyase family protein n=1 Tax=unclassified Streptomyces TaxID=2593676 RepID=UPI00224FFC0C|nr:chorismate pyruvate-lyase family protein [Streptomyces sp. NBC_00094]MCX5389619.1 chorismate pyruvate-lyase family protein [Streptomyces sp. NBC_00094]
MLRPTPPSIRDSEQLFPDGFAVRGATETREELDSFAHTTTRLLLGSDGLTTPLLEAWVGSAVSVRRMSHRLVRACDAPVAAVDLLEASWDEILLERRSVLASSGGVDLSRNVIVARSGVSAAVERCLTDGSATIGRMLQAAGTGHRRTIVGVGLGTWGGEPAAYKTYLLWHGEQPLATITELFNPEIVPAALRAPLALAGRP